jgi:glc operon protein GlcG
MQALGNAAAQVLLSKAVDLAAREFQKPICVSVCDAHGFLLAFARADGAPVRSIAIAQGKAYSSVRMGINTDAFFARLQRDNLHPSYYCDPNLTALAGGAVLKLAKGDIVGGVGISGLAPSEDQHIANTLAEQILKAVV